MGIFVPLEIEAVIIAPEPPDAFDGRMWINEITSDSYVYDGSRAKWLSASDSTLSYSYSGNAGNRYLKVGDISYSEYGYMFNNNYTITTINTVVLENDVSYDVITSISGIDTVRLNFFTDNLVYNNETVDIDVDAGYILKIFSNKEDILSATNPMCFLRKNWRYDI